MNKRLHYIDALRVLAVLLLIPFHSARVFDVWEPFYAKNAVTSMPLSLFIAVIGIWHMPLLFALAGASSYFALAHRNGRGYLGERVTRLLIPLVFGTLVIVPPQMWYGAMTNAGYTGSLVSWWPRFFTTMPVDGDYAGALSPAHLWFVLFLFVISIVALPLMLWWRKRDSVAVWARRFAAPLWWAVPLFALMVSESFPEVGGKNLGRYLVFFLLGFIAMADEAFVDSAEKRRGLMLALAAVGITATMLTWPAADALPDPSWGRAGHALLQNTTAWVSILACLGWGKAFLDRPSRLLSYSAEASYPFYILHQTVIVAIGFYLVQLALPVWAAWPALMVAALVVTLAGYEVVRRVPPLRFLFGMKLRPKTASAPPATGAAA